MWDSPLALVGQNIEYPTMLLGQLINPSLQNQHLWTIRRELPRLSVFGTVVVQVHISMPLIRQGKIPKHEVKADLFDGLPLNTDPDPTGILPRSYSLRDSQVNPNRLN
jgi:hypothetical protein